MINRIANDAVRHSDHRRKYYLKKFPPRPVPNEKNVPKMRLETCVRIAFFTTDFHMICCYNGELLRNLSSWIRRIRSPGT